MKIDYNEEPSDSLEFGELVPISNSKYTIFVPNSFSEELRKKIRAAIASEFLGIRSVDYTRYFKLIPCRFLNNFSSNQ